MKLLRTIALFSFLVSLSVLYLNCKDDGINNQNAENEIVTDDPNQDVKLWVHEYCHITPPVGDPYNAYLQVRLIAHSVLPYGYSPDNFTTPDAYREVEGVIYETINYRITKSGYWKCQPTTCAARYSISGGVLSEDHFYNSTFTCNPNCSPYPNNCGTYFDEDNVNLSQNTYYTMSVGSDCIVGDKWENE